MEQRKVCEKLRALRGNRTIDEIAAQTGIGRSALNNYELGLRVPRDEIKVRLADFYGVSIEWLFFDRDNTNREVC